jgi:general stress protein 26
MVEQSQTDHDRQKVQDLIKDIKIALLVTRGADGKMSGRPMAAISSKFDGGLWFFSKAASPKTGEVFHDNNVLLAYSEPRDQNYVSVSGQAEVVYDRARIKALWTEAARVWFPAGPDDPAICLIHVSVESAEYWDAPSSGWVSAYGYAKARLTGEPPRNSGDNKVVRF